MFLLPSCGLVVVLLDSELKLWHSFKDLRDGKVVLHSLTKHAQEAARLWLAVTDEASPGFCTLHHARVLERFGTGARSVHQRLQQW